MRFHPHPLPVPNPQVIVKGQDKKVNLGVDLRGKVGVDPDEYKGPQRPSQGLFRRAALNLLCTLQHHGNVWWPLSAVFSRSLGMKLGTKGSSPAQTSPSKRA